MTLQQSVQHVLSLVQAGRAAQAIQSADAALAQFPGQSDLLHFKAHALRAVGQLPSAIDVLKLACASAPDNFEMRNTLGNMLKAAGRTDEAEAAYRASIGLNLSYAPAHSNLVSLLIGLEKGAASVLAAEAFVDATGGREAAAFEAQGRALKHQKAWRKSSEAFRKAVSLQSDMLSARYGLASALIETGETETCRDICMALVQSGNTAPQIVRLLARAEMELSDFASAEPHLHQAISAGSGEALKDYANLLWMTGREEDADVLLRGAASAAAERPHQALMAFDEWLDMERPERVVAAFDHLPAELKNDPIFMSRLSMAQSDLGEAESGYALAERAGLAVPDHPVVAYQFIVSALMTGRYDLALKQALLWRDRQPNDQSWIALSADAYRMLGDAEAYDRLYDFERFVTPAELAIPNGYSSLAEFHAEFVEQVHGGSPFRTHPLGQSARQGIQTPRDLMFDERPVVQNYIKALHEPVRAYVERIGNDPSNPMTARNSGAFYIGGVWSIYLLAGGRHVSHIHPRGWVSSAYYVAVPPEADTSPDRAGWIKFGEPPYKLPDAAPARHWVKPTPGTLVLFPAYMWHGTVPISGKAPRVTAPLDVLPGAAP